MAQVYDRTWSFSFDNPAIDTTLQGNFNRKLWHMCSMLTGGTVGGFTTGLWTVAGSSNGVAAGMDAVDRWHLAGAYTAGDFVRAAAGSAHSWMVLKSPLMNGYNFYMLVSLGVTTTALYIIHHMAKAAFTGGSITADPTSTDQWYAGGGNSYDFLLDSTASATWKHNMCLSATGDFIFFSVRTGGGAALGTSLITMVLAPVGCHALDQYPIYQLSGSAQGDTMCAAGIGCITRGAFGALSNPYLPYLGRWYTAATGADSLSGAWPDAPCWVNVIASPPTWWHARGRLPDIHLQTIALGTVSHAPGLTIRDGSGAIRYVTVMAITIPANAAPNFA